MQEQRAPTSRRVLDAANELARVHEACWWSASTPPSPCTTGSRRNWRPSAATPCARIIDDQPQLELLHGKFVFEVKPAGVNKGVAIDAFMNEPPFAGRVPVFAGDDTTDESGFAMVQPRGGIAIKVGSGPSLALHRLDSPLAVFEWLVAGARPAGGRARGACQPSSMSRLVVVSNRVADPRKTAAGGLAVALGDVAAANAAACGSAGAATIVEGGCAGEGELHTQQAGTVKLATIDLSREDHDSLLPGLLQRRAVAGVPLPPGPGAISTPASSAATGA